jgi:hypothetical protein
MLELNVLALDESKYSGSHANEVQTSPDALRCANASYGYWR